MSNKISGLVVTFDEDISEENAKHLQNLLLWLSGVTSVRPIEGNVDQHIAQMRADDEWRNKLLNLMRGES